MKSFIQQLQQRYAAMADTLPMDAELARDVQQRLNALRLASAILTKIELNDAEPDHLPQVGILGPTQAGKSTLVNLLFQSDAAGVSPLAGYTVHAQGFIVGAGDDSAELLATVFGEFSHVTTDGLNQDNLKQYSTEVVNTTGLDNASPLMLWDSPDFDSVESRGYRSAVLRVVALSDLIILMVSKDKYADKSVWDMLGLLKPLLHTKNPNAHAGKKLLVCINKLNSEDTDVVVNSFNNRYRQSINGNELPVIIALPYLRGLDNTASQIAADLRTQLVAEIRQGLVETNRAAQRTGAYHFIQQHWDVWLEPILAEQQARQHWEASVEEALDAGMQRYRSGYLDHPQKYDTFNRALAELLTLLEIPGIAGALTSTRKLVTWPMRKLFNVGQSMLDGGKQESTMPADLEDDVLAQAAQHVLTRLSNLTLDEQEKDDLQSHWWTSVAQSLRANSDPMLQELCIATDQYQAEFTPEVEAAAQKLYGILQEQPAILNTLRAARVSADAAAVVLAVKSGGLAASDLVLAPAMLSVTTMLTESALGKYMDSIKADLKSRQSSKVRAELFDGVMKKHLYALPDRISDSTLRPIDDEDLNTALAQLKAEINE